MDHSARRSSIVLRPPWVGAAADEVRATRPEHGRVSASPEGLEHDLRRRPVPHQRRRHVAQLRQVATVAHHRQRLDESSGLSKGYVGPFDKGLPDMMSAS